MAAHSGNKLSCLDGQVLSQLPQLNAIQLAFNRWQCDCHLRELVRFLGVLDVWGPSTAPWVPARQQLAGGGDQSPAGAGVASALEAPHDSPPRGRGSRRIQLVDEPACQQHNATNQDSSMASRGHAARSLWKNMRLSQFACSPRLAESLMHRPVAVGKHHAWDVLDVATLDGQILSQKNMNMNDPGTNEGPTTGRLLHFEEDSQLTEGQLVELTCAQELDDELQLTEQTIEWWRIPASNPARSAPIPELIWRWSAPQEPPNSQLDSMPSMDLKGDKVAVIDYVTRANSSADLNKSTGLVLVRVTHLLELHSDAADQTGGSAKPLYYLCRISNQIYSLDLVYRVVGRSRNTDGLLEAQRRHIWRKAATEGATSNFRLPELPPASTMGQLLSRVQAASNSSNQLFVPILLPRQLTVALVSQIDARGNPANATTSRGPSKQATSREPQQRSTVSQRQINVTSPADHEMSQLHIDTVAHAEATRLLGAAAINLIYRYTSNRADLAMTPPAHLAQPNHLKPDSMNSSNATSNGLQQQPETTSASFHNYSILALKKRNQWPIVVALVGGGVVLLTFLLSILLASRFKRSVDRRAENLKRQQASEKPSCGLLRNQPDTSKPSKVENRKAVKDTSPRVALEYRVDLDGESNDADMDESLRSHFATNALPPQHPLPSGLFMLNSPKSSCSDTQSCTCQHQRQPVTNQYCSREGDDCVTLGAADTYRSQMSSDHQRPVKMIRFGCTSSIARVAPADCQDQQLAGSLEIGCILNHHQPPPKEAFYNTSSNSTSGCYDPFPTPNSYSSSHCDSSIGHQAPSAMLHHSRCSKQPIETYSQGSNANLVYLDEALRLLQYTVNEGTPVPVFRHQDI